LEAQSFRSRLAATNAGYVNAFDVPTDVADAFQRANINRLVCTVNDAVTFHCALQSYGAGRGYYIMFSRQLQKKTGLGSGDELWVKLVPDTSEYGLPVPEEWAELLAIDEEVTAIFAELTPGRQRSILHLVGAPKREENRINRALRIADNLKLGYRNPQDFLKKEG
jgi:hypothetical protein